MTTSYIKHFVLFGAGCMGAALVPGAPAVAQDTGKAAAGGLEVIVVTARRREESMQEVPISITASSGEELLKKGVQNGYDLQNTVPSLTMSTQGIMSKALMPGIRSVST
jgi:iron complex outermembrane receptor protein